MIHRKHALLLSIGLVIALFIAACGSNTGSGNGGRYGAGASTGANQTATATAAVANNTPTSTATSNSSGNCYRYCSSGSPTPSSSGPSTIKTASLTINGKSVTVLTNSQGLTLYYRTSDTASSVCSGGCASAWPPVIASSTPSASSSLPGKLGLLSDANGSQVTYNGHPLYTYSGDSSPGQSNGQGVGGVWFVVTTGLTA